MDQSDRSTLMGRHFVLYILLLVLAILLRPVPIQVWGIHATPAVIFFPLAFCELAIYTSCYGYDAARRLIWLSVVPVILTTVWVLLDTVVTAATGPHAAAALGQIDLRRILFVFVLALLVGQFTVAMGVSRAKIRVAGRYPLVRLTVIPWTGMALFAISFNLGIVDILPGPLTALVTVVKSLAIFACVIVCASPLTWTWYRMVREHDRTAVDDRTVSLSPFEF